MFDVVFLLLPCLARTLSKNGFSDLNIPFPVKKKTCWCRVFLFKPFGSGTHIILFAYKTSLNKQVNRLLDTKIESQTNRSIQWRWGRWLIYHQWLSPYKVYSLPLHGAILTQITHLRYIFPHLHFECGSPISVHEGWETCCCSPEREREGERGGWGPGVSH